MPRNIPNPKINRALTNKTGMMAMRLMSILYPKKNMRIENGISESNKLKMAANTAESGKLKGCKLIDLRIAELSINEVKTCKTEADRKFQKTSPLKAYKA